MRARARLLAMLCVVAAAFSSSAAPAGAAEPIHPFRGAITGEKIGPFEQFKGACGVAVDSAGNIYVADYYGNRVAVFNAKHEYLTQITGINPLDSGGVAPIDGPCDLALDPAGNLYVNDYHRDVVRFTPAEFPPAKGTAYGPATAISSAHPTGVAVDPASGDVFVDERTSIAVYEAPVLAGAEPSSRIGLGELEDGYGVAVSGFGASDGHVYVADVADGVVEVYDPAGDPSTPIEVIDGTGSPRQGFRSLVDTDLAVDPANGHLYVADNLEPHFEKPEGIVYEFSASGHYRGQVPHPTVEGESSFLVHGEPSGVAVGAGGDVYVTSGNYENGAVYVFGPGDASPTRLLTVAKSGAGSGTVASSPPGLRCGSACTGEFNEGSNVSLTATAPPGSKLAGWSGCDSELTANTCQVTMGADRSVSAEFETVPVEEPPVEEPPVEPPGEEGPSGGPSDGREARTLTVTATGLGDAGGTVRSAPAGIDCAASCSHLFERGAALTLTARAQPGSVFLGWGGCEGANGESCTLTLGADRVLVASFGPAPPGPLRVRRLSVRGATATLAVAVPGPGTLSASGRWLRAAEALPLASGDVALRLRLNAAGRRALARAGGRLRAKANLAFAPLEGGAALKLTRALAFGGKRR